MTPARQIRFDNHLGEKLAGSLDLPAGPIAGGIIFGHCFTCSRHTRILSDISRTMADLGFMALRFDFSGNGASEGEFKDSTYTKQIQEMQCAVDYLRAQGASDIMLAGHSMGGTVSLLTAARTGGILGVIALATGAVLIYPDRYLTGEQKERLDENGETLFSSRGRDLLITRAFFKDAGLYDIKKAMSDIKCPVLLIYGGQDIIVAPGSERILHEANPSRTEVFTIKAADHMFSADGDRREVVDKVIQWVGRIGKRK